MDGGGTRRQIARRRVKEFRINSSLFASVRAPTLAARPLARPLAQGREESDADQTNERSAAARTAASAPAAQAV